MTDEGQFIPVIELLSKFTLGNVKYIAISPDENILEIIFY